MSTVVSFTLCRNFASLNCMYLSCGNCSTILYYNLSLKAFQSRELSNRRTTIISGEVAYFPSNRCDKSGVFFVPLLVVVATNERTNDRPNERELVKRINTLACETSGFFVRRPTGGHRPEDCIAEAHLHALSASWKILMKTSAQRLQRKYKLHLLHNKEARLNLLKSKRISG